MADPSSPTLISILQAVAVIAPALYTGFTFAYTHVLLPPLLTHSPPKLLAKQWLQAYQFAPVYVAPLILLGLTCNFLLAYLILSRLYLVAALLNASIIPYTALYMEPGINGAGKWKVAQMLKEDGGRGVVLVRGTGTGKDTAKEEWKVWAESVEMKTIVEVWGRTNAVRYVVTGMAVVVSACATVMART